MVLSSNGFHWASSKNEGVSLGRSESSLPLPCLFSDALSSSSDTSRVSSGDTPPEKMGADDFSKVAAAAGAAAVNANDGGWDFVGGVEGRGGGRGVRNFIKEKMAEKTLSL